MSRSPGIVDKAIVSGSRSLPDPGGLGNARHLIHLERYAGMDYDMIAAHITANHQKWNGWAMASDVGVGTLYNGSSRRFKGVKPICESTGSHCDALWISSQM